MLWCALLAGIAAYAALAAGLLGGHELFAVYVHTGLYALASAICLLRVIVSPHERRAWTLLTFGMAAWAVGFGFWNARVSAGTYDGDGPFNLCWPLGMALLGYGSLAGLDPLATWLAVGAVVVAFAGRRSASGRSWARWRPGARRSPTSSPGSPTDATSRQSSSAPCAPPTPTAAASCSC